MLVFRPRKHAQRVEGPVVIDVFTPGGELVGVIYPTALGCKVVSKHIEKNPLLVTLDLEEPPAIHVNFLIGRI